MPIRSVGNATSNCEQAKPSEETFSNETEHDFIHSLCIVGLWEGLVWHRFV
jgi:hypothetical protein